MEWDGTEWKCEKIESIYMYSFSCDRMRASDTGVCALLESLPTRAITHSTRRPSTPPPHPSPKSVPAS